MLTLHLVDIGKQDDGSLFEPNPLNDAEKIWRGGNYDLPDYVAKALLNQLCLIHRIEDEPPYMGGRISKVTRIKSGSQAGRYIIEFPYWPEAIDGLKADPTGWHQHRHRWKLSETQLASEKK